jgi:hypothetical protein
LPKPALAYVTVSRRVTMQFVREHPLGMKTAGAKMNGVLLVRHWLPSGWVKSECGLRVWERSVIVGVYYPAMDPPHNPIGHCNDRMAGTSGDAFSNLALARLQPFASRTATRSQRASRVR